MEPLYKIAEIFYSVQGEGTNVGKPAVFIRFAGCDENCPFCDESDLDGEHLSADDIIAEVEARWPDGNVEPFIVLTGGEPTVQAIGSFVAAVREWRPEAYIAMETNGNNVIPEGIDFVTCSPKNGVMPLVTFTEKAPDEWKFLMNNDGSFYVAPAIFSDVAGRRFVQPLWGRQSTAHKAAAFCKKNPEWSLSLQLHKYIGVE